MRIFRNLEAREGNVVLIEERGAGSYYLFNIRSDFCGEWSAAGIQWIMDRYPTEELI